MFYNVNILCCIEINILFVTLLVLIWLIFDLINLVHTYCNMFEQFLLTLRFSNNKLYLYLNINQKSCQSIEFLFN